MTIELAKDYTGKQVLKVKMNPETNDAGAKTIKGYLVNLIQTLIDEGEGFSGKRPFGNSCWEQEMFIALSKAGMITADLDEYDAVNSIDEEEGYRLVRLAIAAL